ncbi:hypothetical protein EWM64_g9882 [Hericium alpestre]|uniref:NAD-P-binding protein n=1 Tax=Hericium alpestre TaxID=135208 RepID=A0A4Y9ZIY5_9AGAM|nr:hypothetical protein EWM64_g9882 [Hericium alpestre]
MAPPSESPSVTARDDVYAAISPEPHFVNQTFKGKVVFVARASRGIGQEIAITYAKASAIVVITGRKQETLDAARASISSLVPHATMLAIPVDVTRTEQVEAAVKATVEKFGKLDICIANAGAIESFDKLIAEQDPEVWWGILEVNIRGVYNLAHAALPHLSQTKGYFFAVSSAAAQIRLPKISAYGLSKHAGIRLVEFIALVEYPDVKTFAFHPGLIKTELSATNPDYLPRSYDSVRLPAATALYLSAGKADWLSGRFVAATWNLEELERDWKDKIIESQALVNRLAIPV